MPRIEQTTAPTAEGTRGDTEWSTKDAGFGVTDGTLHRKDAVLEVGADGFCGAEGDGGDGAMLEQV